MRVDNIDLQIVRLIARDSRTSYKNIASAVGITPSAAKKRINKMISNGVIRSFAVVVNPVIFGYEKECILILKSICKTINEQEIFKTRMISFCFFHFMKLLNLLEKFCQRAMMLVLAFVIIISVS